MQGTLVQLESRFILSDNVIGICASLLSLLSDASKQWYFSLPFNVRSDCCIIVYEKMADLLPSIE